MGVNTIYEHLSYCNIELLCQPCCVRMLKAQQCCHVLIQIYFKQSFQRTRSVHTEKPYLVLCLIDAYQENELSNEQVDTKVLVNSVTITLQATEKTECEDADGQANKRDDNSHPGDDSEEQFVHSIFVLEITKNGEN